MLEICELSRRFGDVTAVDSASLDIPSGQFVGIIGRSGAGKSTLLRMINRLQDPSGGQIIFEGQEITQLKGRSLRHWRSRCAMIFQQFNLVDRLDVLTNVMLGRLYHISTAASLLRLFNDTDRIDAIRTLEWLGMIDSARQHAGTLSGGQQQRVAIARALHQNPSIILADEPIASLDPMNAKRVMDALESIHRDRGITVITNLHTLDTARRYCQRIIGMRDGKVCFDGSPAELTPEAIREIYGVDEDIDESTTSTALATDAHAAGAPSSADPSADNLIPITKSKQYAS